MLLDAVWVGSQLAKVHEGSNFQLCPQRTQISRSLLERRHKRLQGNLNKPSCTLRSGFG